MFDWITHNKGLFLNSYTEIGTSHPHAMELQTQHNHFAMNCMVRDRPSRRALQWKCFSEQEAVTPITSQHAAGGRVGGPQSS